MALLANIGSGWLNAGAEPRRFGNEHPTVVPYGIFPAADGEFVLGCGNDRQFRATCRVALERPDIADDPRFARNQDRQHNRDVLVPLLRSLFLTRPVEHWVKRLMAADVPAAVVRTVPQALTAPEVVSRGVVWTVPHPRLGSVSTVGSPLRLQGMEQPATPPPLLAEHTREVLRDVLGKTDDDIDALARAGAIVAA